MAIPAAFTEAKDKLQRTREQGDRATQGVQRKRYAHLAEVVHFHGKGYVRQQVTKGPDRVHKSEEREHEPQEFRQQSHVGLFCHFSSRCAAPNEVRVPAAARAHRQGQLLVSRVIGQVPSLATDEVVGEPSANRMLESSAATSGLQRDPFTTALYRPMMKGRLFTTRRMVLYSLGLRKETPGVGCHVSIGRKPCTESFVP
jgi:hypothetical protein